MLLLKGLEVWVEGLWFVLVIIVTLKETSFEISTILEKCMYVEDNILSRI